MSKASYAPKPKWFILPFPLKNPFKNTIFQVITTVSLSKDAPKEGKRFSSFGEGRGGEITFAAAQEKIRKYCAYQERCPNDVWQKLREWQIEKGKAKQLLKTLVSEGYINEERFAKAFVRGKFKIKSWGIVKITHELRKKNISESCIAQALKEIDTELYKGTLNKLAQQYLAKHKTETAFVQKQKLFRYLLSKGYQGDEIRDFMNKR